MRRILHGFTAILVTDAGRALAQSCAMCGNSFGQNDPVQRAFSWSILFMMAAPYTIVGTVVTWLFLAHRRAAVRRRSGVVHSLQRVPALKGELP